ncbi:MAG: SRPBCC family protein [Sneathiella sp.]|uniref:SRPBCC family protein n=1 Tax=Sneathiella sp. TaxID=1964365 RepID=UPI003003627E
MNTVNIFNRSHSILIDAPADAVLNYVTNPNSWPEWIAASHEIDSPDRPLVKGDRFREQWHTKSGPAELNWIVTDCEPPHLWIGETATPFIGKIIVRYDVEAVGNQVRFTRSLTNPSRPKPPTQEMIKRIDQEAELSLENIKRNVEAKIRQ